MSVIREITYGIPIPDIYKIRTRFNFTQGRFSREFGFSQKDIVRWERMKAVPRGADRTLLFLIQDYPDIVKEIMEKYKPTKIKET